MLFHNGPWTATDSESVEIRSSSSLADSKLTRQGTVVFASPACDFLTP